MVIGFWHTDNMAIEDIAFDPHAEQTLSVEPTLMRVNNGAGFSTATNTDGRFRARCPVHRLAPVNRN